MLENDDYIDELLGNKKSSAWEKVGKIVVGTALVGALGALGYYGLKKYDIVECGYINKKKGKK